MKVLITGGRSGIGHDFVKAFQADHLSRRDGFDIKDPAAITEIAERSLNYDVFINNAFDGPPHKGWANWGQANLMKALFCKWKDTEKQGYIFNIGSIGSTTEVDQYQDFELYRVSKYALDYYSLEATQAFLQKKVSFKTTLIRPGRLDTLKTRERASWTGVGHTGQEIIDILKLCLNSPKESCLSVIDLNCRI